MAYKVRWYYEDGDLAGIYHVPDKPDEADDVYRTLQDAKRAVVANFNQDIERLKKEIADVKKLRVSDVEWDNYDPLSQAVISLLQMLACS